MSDKIPFRVKIDPSRYDSTMSLKVSQDLLAQFDRLVERMPGAANRSGHMRQAMLDYLARWEPILDEMNGSSSSMVAPNGAFVDSP